MTNIQLNRKPPPNKQSKKYDAEEVFDQLCQASAEVLLLQAIRRRGNLVCRIRLEKIQTTTRLDRQESDRRERLTRRTRDTVSRPPITTWIYIRQVRRVLRIQRRSHQIQYKCSNFWTMQTDSQKRLECRLTTIPELSKKWRDSTKA